MDGSGSIINIIGKVRLRTRSKGWDAKDQKLFITEGVETNLIGNDIQPNLGIELLQKQPPPNGRELRQFPNKSPIGTDVNQIKFSSDRQPDQDLDTPLQREFKVYISRRFPDLIKKTGT